LTRWNDNPVQQKEAQMKWTKAEKEFVGTARVARLATVSPEGIPHNVPVCPLLDSGKIFFGTEAKAKKVRNIDANPRVAIVFDDYTEAWKHLRGIMIQGTARIVTAREFRSVRQKIYAKFLQYQSAAPLGEKDSAIVEVTAEHKLSWGL